MWTISETAKRAKTAKQFRVMHLKELAQTNHLHLQSKYFSPQ